MAIRTSIKLVTHTSAIMGPEMPTPRFISTAVLKILWTENDIPAEVGLETKPRKRTNGPITNMSGLSKISFDKGWQQKQRKTENEETKINALCTSITFRSL